MRLSVKISWQKWHNFLSPIIYLSFISMFNQSWTADGELMSCAGSVLLLVSLLKSLFSLTDRATQWTSFTQSTARQKYCHLTHPSKETETQRFSRSVPVALQPHSFYFIYLFDILLTNLNGIKKWENIFKC